ncbi:PIN domain-like protein, partial [Schizopora paradoxa]
FRHGHGNVGENPELRMLYYRCSHLARYAVIPLFVFDGPGRPEQKREHIVQSNKRHWMELGLKMLLSGLGFDYVDAPGEAEAELSWRNSIGNIDAVISEDSDVLPFGAKVVLRMYVLYLSFSELLRNSQGNAISRGGLFLMALLCGGDYDTRGVSGCGFQTASELASLSFGDALLSAACSKTPDELALFIVGWRAEFLHELSSNSSGMLSCRRRALAASVPGLWPSVDVILAYARPKTS